MIIWKRSPEHVLPPSIAVRGWHRSVGTKQATCSIYGICKMLAVNKCIYSLVEWTVIVH